MKETMKPNTRYLMLYRQSDITPQSLENQIGYKATDEDPPKNRSRDIYLQDSKTPLNQRCWNSAFGYVLSTSPSTTLPISIFSLRFQLILFTSSPVSLLDRLIRYATLFPPISPVFHTAPSDPFHTTNIGWRSIT